MKTRSQCYAVSRNQGILLKQLIFVIFIVLFLSCTKEQNEESNDVLAKDKAVPSVVSVSPANDATAVSTETGLTVVFSEKLDSTTISASAFTLRRGASVVYGTVSYEGTTAIFLPASELEGNTVYTGTIKAGVKDLAGNVTSTDYSWKFTTGEAKDTKAPAVISMTPGANAINVPVLSIITATFNEGIKSETLTTSSFLLKKGTLTVAGTMSISGNTASFTPSSPLSANSLYSVTITREVKDSAGNPMVADYSWSFTTASPVDATAPVIISVLPLENANNVQTNVKPSVTFSEAIDPATMNASTFVLKKDGNNITGTVVLNGTTATLTPAAALSANSTYSVTVMTGVKDLAGNMLAAVKTWNFNTVGLADITAPQVSSVTPANNSIAVQATVKPTVTFNEPVDPATINSATIVLKQGSTIVNGTISLSGNTATFSPGSQLAANTAYTLNVTTGVKDVSGNAIAVPFTSNFTTAAAVPAAKSFASDVIPVLNTCNQCHRHSWTTSSNASTFHSNLVSSGHINLNTPTSGKIYTKLNGGHPSSGVTAEQKATVLTWIKEGSKNN